MGSYRAGYIFRIRDGRCEGQALQPLNMLSISFRLPTSRGLVRAFSSSARRLDHFPNVDRKVWGGETVFTRSQPIFVRYRDSKKRFK